MEGGDESDEEKSEDEGKADNISKGEKNNSDETKDEVSQKKSTPP